MTMVTIMFDTKSSKSESFIYLGVYDECPSYDVSIEWQEVYDGRGREWVVVVVHRFP